MVLLRSLKASIDDIEKAIRKNNNSAEDTTEPPMQVVVNPVVSLPPAIPAYYEAEQRERPIKNKRERIKRTVEYFGVALLAIYTAFTVGMYCANKKAADAAKRAADATSRQIDDFEKVQIARLTFENFNATITPFVVNAEITVRNSGPTVADDLSFKDQTTPYSLETNPFPRPPIGNLAPNPSRGGPSLGPTQTRTYHFWSGAFKVGKEDIFFTPSISYVDIFGKGHRTTDCFTFDAGTKSWVSCPALVQHN
jgi:hypothetical protein